MDLSFLADPLFQSSLATVILIGAAGLAGALALVVAKWVKAHASEKEFFLIQNLAMMATRAAEQGKMAGYVTDKKQTAINAVQAYLTKFGITGVTAAQIESAIESAVLAQFNSYKVGQPQFTFQTPPEE